MCLYSVCFKEFSFDKFLAGFARDGRRNITRLMKIARFFLLDYSQYYDASTNIS
jgi:hypothetical protein